MADSIGYRPASSRGNTEGNAELRGRFTKLPPGPGLSRGEVAAHQVTRLRRATTQIVAEEGYEAVTVRKLTQLAGVSTQAFYRHFGNKEACVLEAYDQALRGAARLVIAAARSEDRWENRLRAALHTYTEVIAGHPDAARLVLLEPFAEAFPARDRMRRTFGLSEAIVQDGFADVLGASVADSLIIKGLVGGLITVTRARLLEGRQDELPELADELTDWMSCFGELEVDGLTWPSPAGGERLLDESDLTDADGRLGSDDRSLVLAAVRKLATSETLGSISAQKIRTAAGVSRRSFEASFGDDRGCLLAAVDQSVNSAFARAKSACPTASTWPGGVYRATVALCDALARDASLARLGFTESLSLGPAALDRRLSKVREIGRSLRAAAPQGAGPAPTVAEASVGGIWTILEHQAVAGGPGSLRRFAPTIAFIALAPMIGPDAALSGIQTEGRALSAA